MKTRSTLLALSLAILLVACGESTEENPTPAPDDTEVVTGTVQVLRAGTLTAQSSTNTVGNVSIVKDSAGKHFLQLSNSFTTKFSTGTVTVYLSTSQTLALNSPGNFQLVSIVGKPGEQFFALPGLPDAKFTHGIIWCGAAAIPFGWAKLE